MCEVITCIAFRYTLLASGCNSIKHCGGRSRCGYGNGIYNTKTSCTSANEQAAQMHSFCAVLVPLTSLQDLLLILTFTKPPGSKNFTTLPERSQFCEIVHKCVPHCYVAKAVDPKKLKYFTSQPIFQAGTRQVLEVVRFAARLAKLA